MITPHVAAGIAVPTSGLGAARSVGPVVRAAVLVGTPTRRIRLRAGVEAAWMPGEGSGTSLSASQGDLRVFSASGSVVFAARGSGTGPYALLGAGVQRMRASGAANPYGTGGTVHAGVGFRMPVARSMLHVEITPQVMLTDFATGKDFSLGTYWPMSIGLSF
jgi:hypothetical protein